MSELRWDPVRGEWIATATARMDRPQMPTDGCPFCPGSGKVPDDYDVHIYPNDFPTFDTPPPPRDLKGDDFFRTKKSYGACDVVLYHPDHNTTLLDLDTTHLSKIADLWQARYLELSKNPKVRFVYIFENNGEAIGVTMPHPHGQIFAFPLIPPILAQELRNSKKHFEKHNRCLICDVIEKETAAGERVVLENDRFVAILPFWARWPYELHVYSKVHLPHIGDFDAATKLDMMRMIKRVIGTYKNFYGFMPGYMMVMHQAPIDAKVDAYYHFHIEFYPVNRSREKLKYRAGCETGANLFINDSAPEKKAAELRSFAAKPED
jgi:UDPglucose--hexose-1-phosphate uridylyltransferase